MQYIKRLTLLIHVLKNLTCKIQTVLNVSNVQELAFFLEANTSVSLYVIFLWK